MVSEEISMQLTKPRKPKHPPIHLFVVHNQKLWSTRPRQTVLFLFLSDVK